jgi:hypothetical protein
MKASSQFVITLVEEMQGLYERYKLQYYQVIIISVLECDAFNFSQSVISATE